MATNPSFKGEESMIPAKMPARTRKFARAVGFRKAVLGVVFILSACSSVPLFGDLGLVETELTSEHTRGNLDRIWAEPPGAMIMLQRNADNDYEQLVGLENRTTLKGDNFLWLNANDGRTGQVSRGLDLKRLIARFGDVPAPFSRIDSNNLSSSSDEVGNYFWQEYSAGPSTTCVFAMRRLGTGARAMPPGTRVLDLVLRNCVNGSASDALAPILNNRSIQYETRGVNTNTRTISQLAGPRP
jgi:hypothetical protein